MDSPRREYAAFLARCANTSGCLPYSLERGCLDLPGRGVAPASRAGDGIEFASGRGCYLFDRSGKPYIDFCNAFGSVTLGHADPDVSAATKAAIDRGVPAGASHDLAASLAHRLSTDSGGGMRTAFFKTGTTAVRAAVTAARRESGRDLVVSCGFHGWDAMWASPPIPFSVTPHGVFDAFYCADVLAAFLEDHARSVAAAVISPDYLHVSPDSLRRLFEVARAAGVLTIADEVKYGYRYGAGPSVRGHDIHADVYVHSKGLANGWPLAAVVGREDVLAEMSEFTSTLTYEQVSLAAAHATLAKAADVGAWDSIAKQGGRFVEAARHVVAESRLPVEIIGTGTAFQIVYEDSTLERTTLARARAAGLLFQPGDQQLPSFALRDAAVDEAVLAFARAFDQLVELFPEHQGRTVSDAARWTAAWLQMDGLPDAMAEGMRHDFLAEKLSPGFAAR